MPRRRASAYRTGTSDYLVNQQQAYASMTPAQRADYQRRSAAIGVGILGTAATIAGGGLVAGVTGATVAATSAALAFHAGLNAQRVIAPNARPAGTRTRRGGR